MSLTTEDLTQIRAIFREENKSIQNELQALHNDIKEIYDELGKMNRELGKVNSRLETLEIPVMPDKDFQKLNSKEQILQINRELIFAAKEAGVTLPRP